MVKNNMSGPPLIYEPMRMAGVSSIELRLSGNAALDFTLFTVSQHKMNPVLIYASECMLILLLCPPVCSCVSL